MGASAAGGLVARTATSTGDQYLIQRAGRQVNREIFSSVKRLAFFVFIHQRNVRSVGSAMPSGYAKVVNGSTVRARCLVFDPEPALNRRLCRLARVVPNRKRRKVPGAPRLASRTVPGRGCRRIRSSVCGAQEFGWGRSQPVRLVERTGIRLLPFACGDAGPLPRHRPGL